MLTKEDVKKVAKLARLNLSDQEIEGFRKQLGQIIEYTESLRDIPTEDIEAMAQPNHLKNVLRSDLPQKSLDRETILQQAPDADDARGGFTVPRILEL